MSETHKQVIVMRTDLNMRKGKMVAQGAHASMKVLVDQLRVSDMDTWRLHRHPNWVAWLQGKFTKVCVGIDSEAGLLELYVTAKAAGLLCAVIQDAGLTEFNGVPTVTCCAIGPGRIEDIDKITGNLKLL